MTLKGNFLHTPVTVLTPTWPKHSFIGWRSEDARRGQIHSHNQVHEHCLYLGFDAQWCWNKFVHVVPTGFVSLRRTLFFYSLWIVSPSSPAHLHHVSGFQWKTGSAEVKGRRRKATKKCVAHDGCSFALGPVVFCYNFRGVYHTTGAGIWSDGRDTRGVRTDDGLLFRVMSVFVIMTVDTHPVLWSCLSSWIEFPYNEYARRFARLMLFRCFALVNSQTSWASDMFF